MSGVLNRMVQRVRGQLPGVEPLVKSHQTATAALPITAEGRLEPIATVLTTEHRTGQRQPPSLELQTPSGTPTGTDTSRARAAKQGNTSDRSRADAEVQIRDVSPAPVAQSHRELSRDNSESHSASNNSPQQPLEEPENLILEVRTVLPLIVDPRLVPAPHDADDSAGQKTHASSSETEPPITRQGSPSRLPESHTDTAQQLETTSEHTEIHITIGSIELRASRSEDPPKPPAFKSRVSLDEFLSRRQGAE